MKRLDLTLYCVANGFAHRSMSGGAKIFIETVRAHINNGIKVVIITNKIGIFLFNQENIGDVEFILTDEKEEDLLNPISIFFWYIKRGIKSCQIISQIKRRPGNKIWLFESDFYCNTITTPFLKNEKLIVIFAMVAPSPFYGYINKLHFPSIQEFHYYVSNLFTFLIIRIFKKISNVIFIAITPNVLEDLKRNKIISKFNTEIIYPGIDDFTSQNYEKIYDFVWIGRNHPQKGIDDLEKIILYIKKEMHDFKILIIGELEDRMNNFAKTHNCAQNIVAVGKKYNKEKFALLSQAKVFLFTSHFESLGIVVIENMLVENLIVGFDIASSRVNYEGKMEFVKQFDTYEFADKAIDLLKHYDEKKMLIDSNKEFALTFNWNNIFLKYQKIYTEFYEFQ